MFPQAPLVLPDYDWVPSNRYPPQIWTPWIGAVWAMRALGHDCDRVLVRDHDCLLQSSDQAELETDPFLLRDGLAYRLRHRWIVRHTRCEPDLRRKRSRAQPGDRRNVYRLRYRAQQELCHDVGSASHDHRCQTIGHTVVPL